MLKNTDIILKKWIVEKIDDEQNIKLPVKFRCKIEKETDRAILINYQNKKFWVPKSQIVASGSNVYQSTIDGWQNE
jgi:hypothetical protein